MPDPSLSKILIMIGLGITAIGTVLYFFPSLSQWRGLPGDIHLRGENYSFSFPIVTCIVLSIVLTVIMRIFRN